MGSHVMSEAALSPIADTKIKSYYRAEFRDRLSRLLAGPGRETPRAGRRVGGSSFSQRAGFAGQRGGGKGFAGGPARTALFARTEVARSTTPSFALRERLLVLIVLNQPGLLEQHMEDFAGLELQNPDLDKLRSEIIRIAAGESDLDTEALKRHLKERGFAESLSALEQRGALVNVWYAWPDAALVDATRGWLQCMAFHRRVLVLAADKKAAEKALAEDMTEETFERFRALTLQLEEAEGQEASLEGFGLASGREIPA